MTTFITIEQWDKALFEKINSGWAVPMLDWFMQMLREPLVWIPLYAGVLIWVWWKMPRQLWLFVMLTLVTFAITDYGNSSILKPLFARARPCHDPDLQASMRVLVPCGGFNSMPSSHAANHFGLAMFWFSAVRIIKGKNWYWVWIWAFAIGYAQVYVGKHYPADILAGAMVGVLAGWAATALLRYSLKENSFLQRLVRKRRQA